MAYIVSKASQDIEYCDWQKSRNGLNIKKFSVIIKGGANVLDKRTMETSKGTITEVSAAELKFLEGNSAFKRHQERGWMKICKTKGDAEKKAAEEMKDDNGDVVKDGTAQLTAEDFEKKGQKPPIVNPDDLVK